MISPLSRLPPFTSKYMGLFKALFEFLRTAIVIITALIAVVAASTTTAWALLEITLVALYKAVVFTLTLSEYFYSRCVGELQLTTGDIVQLSTDLVIMCTFFMPGAVGQFHVVSDGIGEASALFRVLFCQCFFDHHFKVFTEM